MKHHISIVPVRLHDASNHIQQCCMRIDCEISYSYASADNIVAKAIVSGNLQLNFCFYTCATIQKHPSANSPHNRRNLKIHTRIVRRDSWMFNQRSSFFIERLLRSTCWSFSSSRHKHSQAGVMYRLELEFIWNSEFSSQNGTISLIWAASASLEWWIGHFSS